MFKNILRVLSFVSIIISVVFTYMFYMEVKPLVIADRKCSSIRNSVVYDSKNGSPLDRKIDFNILKSINKDIIGWIYIPGTNIDYPILNSINYIDKDYEGIYNKAGSIISEGGNFNMAHSYILGHNMARKIMFGELKNYYNDEEFLKSHSTFYIYTNEKTYEVGIYSVFVCKYNDSIFNGNYEIGSLDYKDRISNLKYRNSGDISINDKYLQGNGKTFSLVSCYGREGTDNRLIVSGVTLREKYIIN